MIAGEGIRWRRVDFSLVRDPFVLCNPKILQAPWPCSDSAAVSILLSPIIPIYNLAATFPNNLLIIGFNVLNNNPTPQPIIPA